VGPQSGVTNETVRPAWYALRGGGWRDWVTLLHPPYTLWHLSYVAVGAGLAPHFHLDRLLWALAAFFLAMGVAAHAFDELHGRPLHTHIPSSALAVAAFVALGGAAGIGIAAASAWGWWLLVFVAAGAVLGEGSEVPPGHLAAGVPATVKKPLGGSSASSSNRWVGMAAKKYQARAPTYREKLKRVDRR